MSNTAQPLGVVEEGRCERCGTNCPRRRIAVRLPCGDVQRWGVDCTALAVYGRKSRAGQQAIVREIEQQALRRAWDDRAHLARIAAVDKPVRLRVSGRDEWVTLAGPTSLDECKNFANRLYRETCRSLEGSFFAGRGGEVVRVDGSDAADAAWYESQGFERL
jgi:hypothetical protein